MNASDKIGQYIVETAAFAKDEMVAVKHGKDAWYAGVVTTVSRNGTYTVTYNDGDVHKGLAEKDIKAVKGACKKTAYTDAEIKKLLVAPVKAPAAAPTPPVVVQKADGTKGKAPKPPAKSDAGESEGKESWNVTFRKWFLAAAREEGYPSKSSMGQVRYHSYPSNTLFLLGDYDAELQILLSGGPKASWTLYYKYSPLSKGAFSPADLKSEAAFKKAFKKLVGDLREANKIGKDRDNQSGQRFNNVMRMLKTFR
jgi:hypothetical protein